MGWSPKINFQLRDDQTSFGSLIVNSASVDYLCRLLHDIKTGKCSDINELHKVLSKDVFTDDEFQRISEEYDNIKEDISVFKDYCKKAGVGGIGNFLKRLSINTNYIAGSTTWIDKYKEIKMCAAELYSRLLERGYNFSDTERTTYDTRYSDVLAQSNMHERVGKFLQEQFAEDLAKGVPNAIDKYVNAMVDTGLCNRAQAESKVAFLRINNGIADTNDTKDTANVVEDAKDSCPVEPTKVDESVCVTYGLLDRWIDKLSSNNICYEHVRALNNLVCLIFDRIGIRYKHVEDYDSDANIIADTFKLVYLASLGVNKSLIAAEEYTIKKSDYPYFF